MTPLYKQVAIIALLNSKNELLLHLRDNKPEIVHPNTWGFIGGSIEPGESELEGMKREILEEINIEVQPIIKIGNFSVPNLKMMINVFLGKLDIESEKIKLSEGQMVKFFNFEDMKNISMPGPLREFIIKNYSKIFI